MKTETQQPDNLFQYHTQENDTIQYRLIFPGEPNDNGNSTGSPFARKEPVKQYSRMERQWIRDGRFDFSSRRNKISDSADVAFIFRQLESEAIEHAFVVYQQQDGEFAIQWIGSGGPTATYVDLRSVAEGIRRFSPAKIYFVHNHPSGDLTVSQADFDTCDYLRDIGSVHNIDVEFLIINLRSGKYVAVDVSTYNRNELDTPAGDDIFQPVVHSFSKQVFFSDFQPAIIRDSRATAAYISSVRFGTGRKAGLIVTGSQGAINAHFIVDPDFSMPDKTVQEAAALCVKYGGTGVVFYTNQVHGPELTAQAIRIRSLLKNYRVEVLDFLSIPSFQQSHYKLYSLQGENFLVREDISSYDNGENAGQGRPMKERSLSSYLKNNLLVLQTLSDLPAGGSTTAVNPDQRKLLQSFQGFGPAGSFILNHDDPDSWKEYEKPLHPIVEEIFGTIRRIAGVDEARLKALMTSLYNATLTSYYTPAELARGIVQEIIPHLPQVEGTLRILEPSAGSGRFIDALLPLKEERTIRIDAIEKDLLTGMILQAIHQGDDSVDVIIDGYENSRAALRPQGYHLVITNVPFGPIKVFDKDAYTTAKRDDVLLNAQRKIHNYYFVRSLEHLAEGGILAFITTSEFTDSPFQQEFRKRMCMRGEVLANIKLPTNLFAESNAAVQSNFVLFRRDSHKKTLTHRDQLFINNPDKEHHPFGKRENSLFNNFNMRSSAFSSSSPHYDFEGTFEEMAIAFQNILRAQADAFLPGKAEGKKRSRKQDPDLPPAKKLPEKPQLSLFDTVFGPGPSLAARQDAGYLAFTGTIHPWYRVNTLVYDPESKKLGGLLFSSSGQPQLAEASFSTRDFAAHYALVHLRDTYMLLYAHESRTEVPHPVYRTFMNTYYDLFVKEFWVLNDARNKKYLALHDNPSLFRNLEFEVEKNVFRKADIFEKCLFLKPKTPITLNAKDSLAYCLNRTGTVELQVMQEVSGIDERELIRNLEGRIYFNADTRSWQEASYFLSGDIYEKVEAQETGINAAPALDNEELNYAIDGLNALKKILPPKVPFHEIGLQLGERWLPERIYQEFAEKLFQAPVEIRYIRSQDEFRTVLAKNRHNALINETYAVKGNREEYDGLTVFEYALLDKVPRITKKIKEGDTEKTVPDREAIELFKGKTDTIRAEFDQFLLNLSDEEKLALEDIYNRLFNGTVKQRVDGSHLSLSDLQVFQPRFYQKDSAWQVIQNHGGIVDLPVGAGKTLVMIMAAHEMKRLGIVKKPMIIALKSTVVQIANTYKQCYPYDRVLYPTEKDFEQKNQQNIFLQMANNEWDCIILTHEQFKAIPQSRRIQQQIIQEQADQLADDIKFLEGSGASKREKRRLQVKMEGLKAALSALAESIKHNKDLVDFERIGIDKLFVDESQEFKNLFYHTRHQNVRGLGNAEGSQKAFNLYIAIQTMQQKVNRDLQATFSSGSTIKNSIVEMYLLFKYLRPRKIEKLGCPSFDRWASIFAKKSTEYEFNVNGQIQSTDRFRTFVKVPELSKLYSDITYYMHPKALNVEKPQLRETLINIEPTAQQKGYIQRLIAFANNPDPSILDLHIDSEKARLCRMLICTDLGKKMTLDMRMINPLLYHDEPDSKLSKAAENIYKYYQSSHYFKGTQLVFCDVGAPNTSGRFSAYKELKRKLIEDYRIPANEVVFIHDATSDAKRDQLFQKVNAGLVRVVIGSTKKLGTGVNCQERVIALHHLDIPWTPEDMKQRNGRGARPGNTYAAKYNNNIVDSYVYATNNTIDIFRFQLLRNKAEFIEQIKVNENGTRTVDEGGLDESGAMGYAEFVATLSGNRLLIDKMKLDMKVLQLERERKTFYGNQHMIKNKIHWMERDIVRDTAILEQVRNDLKVLASHPVALDEKGTRILDIELMGKKYNDPAEFGQALLDLYNVSYAQQFTRRVGSFRGFDLFLEQDPFKKKLYARHGNGPKYLSSDGEPNQDPIYAARYFYQALDRAEALEEQYISGLQRNRKDVELLKGSDTVWMKEGELTAAKLRLKEIDDQLEEERKTLSTTIKVNESAAIGGIEESDGPDEDEQYTGNKNKMK